MPVYTRHDALQLHGLPEFSRGLIYWRQGAVNRALDGRLTFDRHRVRRQGPNPFLDQPAETLSIIIDTLPTTEENTRLLQTWKQVSRGWKRHIESYSGPDNQWQCNLRVEIRSLWQALYHRATAIVRNERDPHLFTKREEMATLIKDLCTTLETFSYSRAMIGGVALIIITLTRPNAKVRETLGQLQPRTPNPFKQERILLQSLLSAGILRHGLAPTPWHSSRTGPRHILPGALEEKHIDILPRLQIFRLPTGARPEDQLLRDDDTCLPILQEPALTRTDGNTKDSTFSRFSKPLRKWGIPPQAVRRTSLY